MTENKGNTNNAEQEKAVLEDKLKNILKQAFSASKVRKAGAWDYRSLNDKEAVFLEVTGMPGGYAAKIICWGTTADSDSYHFSIEPSSHRVPSFMKVSTTHEGSLEQVTDFVIMWLSEVMDAFQKEIMIAMGGGYNKKAWGFKKIDLSE